MLSDRVIYGRPLGIMEPAAARLEPETRWSSFKRRGERPEHHGERAAVFGRERRGDRGHRRGEGRGIDSGHGWFGCGGNGLLRLRRWGSGRDARA